MDWRNIGIRTAAWAKKYRYVVIVLLVGILLMVLPQREENTGEGQATSSTEETISMEERLEEILSAVEGAGSVRVLLTERAGESILYQTDEDSSQSGESSSRRSSTVLVTGTDRTDEGLVRQVNPPEYLGAVVVCQGGNDPKVCLAITEAVSRVTGLGADRISVLKMK